MKEFIEWLLATCKTIPAKVIGVIICLLVAILAFFFQSCGVTKAYIRNAKDGASTTITITTSNPTSVSAPTTADICVPIGKPTE